MTPNDTHVIKWTFGPINTIEVTISNDHYRVNLSTVIL